MNLAEKVSTCEGRTAIERDRVTKEQSAMKKSLRSGIKGLRDLLNQKQNELMEVVREGRFCGPQPLIWQDCFSVQRCPSPYWSWQHWFVAASTHSWPQQAWSTGQRAPCLGKGQHVGGSGGSPEPPKHLG